MVTGNPIASAVYSTGVGAGKDGGHSREGLCHFRRLQKALLTQGNIGRADAHAFAIREIRQGVADQVDFLHSNSPPK